jgi:germination protein M
MHRNEDIMKKLIGRLTIFAAVLLLCGCSDKEPEGDNVYSIYYLNNSATKVETHRQVVESDTLENMVDEMITALSTTPEKLEYKAPLALFHVQNVSVDEDRVTIDADNDYSAMPATTEVLVRAAIVRTLTQLEQIKYVSITINGEQLYDNTGSPVGLMSADQFINNDGNEINTYELIKVKLYFANEDGDKLIAAYREKHYSTNTPLERFVVEEIIAGPSGQIAGLYPTVNPDTKIISVSTRDGICYVNLDSSFMTVVNNVSTELAIYSIVDSLAELSNINKVQILINGEVPASFSASTYERNLDFVTTLEP